MNWNGEAKNNALGKLQACREQIAAVQQRGYVSDEASFLLGQVNPEEHTAALISLIAPLQSWADSLDGMTREKWLLWALQNRPEHIKGWLGYNGDWSLIPAVCKGPEEVKRLAYKGGLPALYLLPAEPRKQDKERSTMITLETGHLVEGVQLATVTYALIKDEWYKVFPAKLPSKSALTRAIRLYTLGRLIERPITSTKDLLVYEVVGVKSWMLYNGQDIEQPVTHQAAEAMWYLVAYPGVELGT